MNRARNNRQHTKMATIVGRVLMAVILLALMVLFVSGVQQRRSSVWPPPSCVELQESDDCCVRSFFVRELKPLVGYYDSDDRELTNKGRFAPVPGFCSVACDDRCFSYMPNLITYIVFRYFPPCFTSFSNTAYVFPPCQSLCEAANTEYSHYSRSRNEVLRACPSAVNLIWLDIFGYIYKFFNCSQYTTYMYGTCVPERPPSMSCDFLPSNHIARRVDSSHSQTGYPAANSDLQETHLLSLMHASAEFRHYGLEAMVNDSECRKNLPNTIFFITLAYFPLCTAHKDRNSTLTYPCRNVCEAARIELGRYASNTCLDWLTCDCPAAVGLTLTIAQALELSALNCSRYNQNTCAQNPDLAWPGKPSCKCYQSNQTHTSQCRASIRHKVTKKSFIGKHYGKCHIRATLYTCMTVDILPK